MINVSNAFKNELYLDRRNYLEYADITLSDGTKLPLTNKDFWQGGMSLDDAVSGNDTFEIGAAIVNSCSLTIENIDDRFSEYDFLNAKVVIYIGLNLPDGTTEKIRKGTYTVNDPKYNGATISLNCQDNMEKFDRPYSESKLTYPATLNQIVLNACSTCDVLLQTYDFPHDDFIVQTRPTDEAITFREVISWVAQIAGCFCRCDTQGRLELKWYDQKSLEKHGYDGGIFDKVSSTRYTTGDNVDGGLFNPWNVGDAYDGGTFKEMEGIHHIYSHYSSPIVSTDDVVITGVRVLEKAKEQDEETGSEKDVIITYQSGSDGYVVSIENNELIQGGAGLEISNWLGQQLIGFRFRKASLSHASDPTIEAGDVAIVTDRKQNTYPIIVSSTRFSTGSAQSTESSAETPARNSAARFSAQTKNYVEYRKDIQRERTEREKAQDELKERIDSSSGLYTTEQTQPDGSTIFYMHDKPTLEESKIVWKMTAEAWGVSTDGGDTYNAGMTVDGDTIVRILTAVGVNADWIKTGAFRIEKDGRVIFLADASTKQVKIVADEFSLSDGRTIDSIAEDKAETAVNAQTQLSIFNKLTNNGSVQGIFLSNGRIYINAEFMSVSTLSSITANLGTVTVGKLQSTNYSAGTGNFSGAGTLMDLSNGSIRSKQFAIDSSGNAHFKGALEAATGTFSGTLSAATGSFSGAVTASSGQIGPWKVNDQAIFNNIAYTGKKDTNSTGIGPFGSDWAFWAGNGRFWVKQDGTLYAEKGTFAGELSAATGTFKGNLSAAGGSFKGELSAATGTFKGNLSAVSGSFDTITAGKLQSSDYDYTSGNYFSTTGFLINMSNGVIRSKQFLIDTNGNARFKGKLEAADGTFAGELSAATGTFKGSLSAATGSFSGSITATSGQIGPWKVNDQAIFNNIAYTGKKDTNSTGIGNYGGNWAFWAGNGRFSVTQDGALYAESGTFKGSLSGAGGTFNGNISGASGTFTGGVTNTSGDFSTRINSGNLYSYYSNTLKCTYGLAERSNIYKEGIPFDSTVVNLVSVGSPMIRVNSGNYFCFIVGSSIYMDFSSGYNINVSANMRIAGNLTLKGSKSRIASTENYQERLLYCYEMPSPMFGDIGEAITDENGECYIFLDDVFSETVSAQIEYQVFLQKEGPGDVWVDSKELAFFIVKGTPNLKFAWEIKAKQKGYEYERLETYAKDETEEIDYEQQYLEELESLIREQEEMYYETA